MTREIANWFHEREGELFTVDETPFTREEIVEVVNDSVDPVQQVMVDGEKYIGVISYDEHDGWYEYTRWDDSAGEVNIGVCAKCIQEKEVVSEVSRTIGRSTESASNWFELHYNKIHRNVKPDEIETGATLLSGTTINSNEAIHTGMDGAGSGVDADFVTGNEALKTGSFYAFTETPAGEPQQQIAAAQGTLEDVAFDGNGCMWTTNSRGSSYASIYVMKKSDGTVQSQYDVGKGRGIDVNQNDSVWHSDYDSIYKKTYNFGSTVKSFASPSGGRPGVVEDSGTNCVWITDTSSNSFYKVNQSGTVQNGFSSPSDFPRGIEIDSNNRVWVYEENNSAQGYYIYDKSGNLVRSFTPANTDQLGGPGFDSSDSLWVAHTLGDSIYQITKNTVLEF